MIYYAERAVGFSVEKMGKKLSEMTLEELWRLFPIKLAERGAFGQITTIRRNLLLKAFLMTVGITYQSHWKYSNLMVLGLILLSIFL